MTTVRRLPGDSPLSSGTGKPSPTGPALPAPRLLLLVILAAIVLRALYYLQMRTSPNFQNLLVDAAGYAEWGRRIAQGQWLGQEVFYQEPLYAYLLGGTFALFGHSLVPVFLLQLLLGVGTAVMTTMLAYRGFFEHPRRDTITAVAGLLCALSTPLVFFELLTLKATVSVFLTVVHLLLLSWVPILDKPRAMLLMALAAGLVLGLNLLTRGNYFVLAPLFGLWLLFWLRSVGGWRRAIFVVGSYTLGVLILGAPVTLRNHHVSGDWVLVTSQGGANFYIGNHSGNTTGTYDVPDDIRPNPAYERLDFLAKARRETGQALSYSEADRYYWLRTWGWIWNNPWQAGNGFVRKLSLMFAGYEVPDNYSFQFVARHDAPVLFFPVANGYVLGVLGWAGIVLWCVQRNQPRRTTIVGSLLLLFAVAYASSVVLFFVFARYRLPIYPVLAVFAAWGVVRLLDSWRERNRRVQIVGVALILILAVLFTRPLWLDDWWWFERIAKGTQHYNAGVVAFERGRAETGFEHLDTAVSLLGSNHRNVLLGAARIYLRHGRSAEALAVLESLLSTRPGDAQALELLSEAQGDKSR